jgi:hypothetical protein
MKTLHNFQRGAFHIWRLFHFTTALFGISNSECLEPQWAKQFWMILVLALRQISPINCTACKRSIIALPPYLLVMSVDFPWIASIMQFTNFARCKVLKFLMNPFSIGRNRYSYVVLGDSDSNLISCKECKWGYAAQLSTTRKMFLDFHCNSTSKLIGHLLQISDVSHACLAYRTDKLSILMPLKQRGLALFPVTSSFCLSVPNMFEQRSAFAQSVILELLVCSFIK